VALSHEARSFWRGSATCSKGRSVAARDTAQQQIEIGAQPDGDRPLADQRPGARIHEGAAARCQHMNRIVEQPGDDAGARRRGNSRLAMALEDLRDGASRRALDLMIGIDEGQAQAVGEALCRCSFLPAPISPTRTMVFAGAFADPGPSFVAAVIAIAPSFPPSLCPAALQPVALPPAGIATRWPRR